jgi:hypothetical protein
MNEQSGNIYENKGAPWKTGAEAGTFQKTKELCLEGRNVVENKGGTLRNGSRLRGLVADSRKSCLCQSRDLRYPAVTGRGLD